MDDDANAADDFMVIELRLSEGDDEIDDEDGRNVDEVEEDVDFDDDSRKEDETDAEEGGSGTALTAEADKRDDREKFNPTRERYSGL
jgi:hypothetical protein